MGSVYINVMLGVVHGIAGKYRNIGSAIYFGLHNHATTCPKTIKSKWQQQKGKFMHNDLTFIPENTITACPNV